MSREKEKEKYVNRRFKIREKTCDETFYRFWNLASVSRAVLSQRRKCCPQYGLAQGLALLAFSMAFKASMFSLAISTAKKLKLLLRNQEMMSSSMSINMAICGTYWPRVSLSKNCDTQHMLKYIPTSKLRIHRLLIIT